MALFAHLTHLNQSQLNFITDKDAVLMGLALGNLFNGDDIAVNLIIESYLLREHAFLTIHT